MSKASFAEEVSSAVGDGAGPTELSVLLDIDQLAKTGRHNDRIISRTKYGSIVGADAINRLPLGEPL
jgi:hypothetical protein